MFGIKAAYKNKKIFLKAKNITKDTQEGIKHGLYFLGKDLVRNSIELINKKPKTGKIYTIIKNGVHVMHQSSAAGEAPAVITGRLRASLGFVVNGWRDMEFGAKRNVRMSSKIKGNGFTVTGTRASKIDYPADLEDGTKKMKARPFLKPSIKNNYRNAQVHFKTQIENRLKNK